MDRDFIETLQKDDILKLNLKAAYEMLSEIELTEGVPMPIKTAISTFLANRFYFATPRRESPQPGDCPTCGKEKAFNYCVAGHRWPAVTECCHAEIVDGEMLCRKCGWTARGMERESRDEGLLEEVASLVVAGRINDQPAAFDRIEALLTKVGWLAEDVRPKP